MRLALRDLNTESVIIEKARAPVSLGFFVWRESDLWGRLYKTLYWWNIHRYNGNLKSFNRYVVDYRGRLKIRKWSLHLETNIGIDRELAQKLYELSEEMAGNR